jgi:3-oxoacyl-[acyl-carrier protein] reductase
MDLAGKIALVTGGSRGIGAAICSELADSGADVAFTHLVQEEEEAGAVAEQLRGKNRKAEKYALDITDFSAAQALVAEVIKEFGGLDILVNNAGMNWDGVIWKMTEEQWDRVINVDLKGTFNLIRAAAPVFKQQQSGKIVSITSINGLRGRFGQANYAAAKAGMIGLTKTVAKELGRYRVNVNAVAPGMIETEMIKNLPEEVKQKSRSETVFQSLGKPEDVAYLVAFLCSEKAGHITGEIIKVDGGQYI